MQPLSLVYYNSVNLYYLYASTLLALISMSSLSVPSAFSSSSSTTSSLLTLSQQQHHHQFGCHHHHHNIIIINHHHYCHHHCSCQQQQHQHHHHNVNFISTIIIVVVVIIPSRVNISPIVIQSSLFREYKISFWVKTVKKLQTKVLPMSYI